MKIDKFILMIFLTTVFGWAICLPIFAQSGNSEADPLTPMFPNSSNNAAAGTSAGTSGSASCAAATASTPAGGVLGYILKGVPCASVSSEVNCTTQKVNASIGGGIGSKYQAAPDCNICDLIKVAVNVADMITGLSGAIALLMFVYGGLLMILTFVNPEFQRKGISVMTLTLIGLAIIFGAWTMVNVVILAVTGEASNGFSSVGQVLGQDWNNCKVGGVPSYMQNEGPQG